MLYCIIKSNLNLQSIYKKTGSLYGVLSWWNRRYSQSKFKITSRPLKKNLPKIMKLDTLQFKSCITEEVKILEKMFTAHGYEIRIVGGAVRDLLMGIQPSDLDFSTTATPSEMKLMFEKNNYRIINNNGEKHGTITTRINDKNFEITTLRIDFATDGRHAQVEFTTEWALDANRRDLTVNAMYLGLDGTLYDYFNGYEDLKNKRLVFVGDTSERIREDYLRIIRYFRFYGKICEVPEKHDKDVLKAIVEHAEGLKDISGERIWMEINKIFEGRYVGDIILKMLNLGIGPYIGIQKYNESEFKKVWDRLKMKDFKIKPLTLLSALFDSKLELDDFHIRVKLSNVDRDLGYFIIDERNKKTEPNSIRYYQKLIISSNHKENFVFELLKYEGLYDILEELNKWQAPIFPIKGYMILDKGYKGKEVGEILKYLKGIWIAHHFDISEEKLLDLIPKKLLPGYTKSESRLRT